MCACTIILLDYKCHAGSVWGEPAAELRKALSDRSRDETQKAIDYEDCMK